MIQDRAIVITECKWETTPKLSNDTIFNDPKLRFQARAII